MRTWITLLTTFLLTAGCGKAPDAIAPQNPSPPLDSSSAAAGPTTSGSDPGTPALPTPPATVPSTGGPAAWSALGNTTAWTKAVQSIVQRDLAKFEAAKDVASFCPGYASATLAQRETCWVRLVSGVTQLESDFNPASMYFENFGVWSVGLMQLSPGECPNAPTIAALKDPIQNLVCGTAKMATLIAKYGYVTTPDGVHGAAAYWSTLRGSKKIQVEHIAAQYRQVAPVTPAWDPGGSVMLSELEP